jgi:hypothetical protein
MRHLGAVVRSPGAPRRPRGCPDPNPARTLKGDQSRVSRRMEVALPHRVADRRKGSLRRVAAPIYIDPPYGGFMTYPAKAANLLVQMSKEQKAQIMALAQEHGMTQRAFVLWRTLGVEELDLGKPGRKPRRQDALPIPEGEGLRMTG